MATTPTPPPATRKRRRVFPLYAKVLLLFFLNVLLVAGGAFWMLRTVFELDRDLLVDRNARERLQTFGMTLWKELDTSPRKNWGARLQAQATENHVQLGMVDADGIWLAGERHVIPQRLAELIQRAGKSQRSGPPPRPAGPPGGGGGDEFDFMEEEDRGRSGPQREPKGPIRIEAMKADGAYWFLLRLPPMRAVGPPDRPPALIGRVESLGETTLLFNPKPWFFAGLGVLGISSLLWLPLVRSLTRSLSQMTHATTKVADGQFDVRVDERRRDELGQLGSAINSMSERLSGFVNGQRRFLGDIAHELCSPLVRMEMALGILEQKAPEALLERLTDVREEVREMRELVSELLSFSKAGFHGVNPLREVVPLGAVVQSAIAREAPGAEVNVDLLEHCEVVVAPAMLGRALGNLLRNAVRYAGDHGPIEIMAHSEGDLVEISVADRGPGVPEQDLPRLFDPFFRSDLSRTRETGGVGLGLAIVKSCMESCGGTVVAANRPDGGLIVTLRLQAAES